MHTQGKATSLGSTATAYTYEDGRQDNILKQIPYAGIGAFKLRHSEIALDEDSAFHSRHTATQTHSHILSHQKYMYFIK